MVISSACHQRSRDHVPVRGCLSNYRRRLHLTFTVKKKTLLGAERGLRLGKGEDSLKHTVNVALGKGFT